MKLPWKPQRKTLPQLKQAGNLKPSTLSPKMNNKYIFSSCLIKKTTLFYFSVILVVLHLLLLRLLGLLSLESRIKHLVGMLLNSLSVEHLAVFIVGRVFIYNKKIWIFGYIFFGETRYLPSAASCSNSTGLSLTRVLYWGRTAWLICRMLTGSPTGAVADGIDAFWFWMIKGDNREYAKTTWMSFFWRKREGLGFLPLATPCPQYLLQAIEAC